MILDRNGEEYWRSEICAYLPDIFHILLGFNWSPNGRYFMFRIGNPVSGNIYTSILDIETGEVRQYPFWGFYFIWSPDSNQYIILEHVYDISNHISSYNGMNIVDMERNEVLHIEGPLYVPVAWLTVDE